MSSLGKTKQDRGNSLGLGNLNKVDWLWGYIGGL